MVQDSEKYFQLSPFFVDSVSMPDLNWDRLQDKIDKMPPNLANLLTDAKTSQFIETLTQKYIQLSVQGPDIARLIRDVVIADIFIGNMPQEFSEKLGIDQASAREVTNVIVGQLFAPVLEDIKKVQSAKFPGRLPIKPVAPPTATPPSYAKTSPFAKATEDKSEGTAKKYPGDNLPESGGNIIDLRSK